MNRTRTRWSVAVAASTLLLVPLAACGGDDAASTSAQSANSTATTPTDPASTTAPGTEVEVETFLAMLTEAMDEQSSVHMSISGTTAVQLEADVRYGKNAAIRMETSIAGSEVTMLVVDGTPYIQQPNGKYLVITENDPTFGSLFGSFDDFGPRGSVKELRAGVTKVVDAGMATVDGESLHQFDVTADTAKLLGSFSQLSGAGQDAETLAMSFFLDADGLVRQISVATAGTTVSMQFTDWGKPVQITAPTGAQLVKPTA